MRRGELGREREDDDLGMVAQFIPGVLRGKSLQIDESARPARWACGMAPALAARCAHCTIEHRKAMRLARETTSYT